MKFNYELRPSKPYEGGLPIFEPIVPIELLGPTGAIRFRALLDTGSHISVFPNISASSKHLTGNSSKLRGVVAGNEKLIFEGRGISICIGSDGEKYVWEAGVWFTEDDTHRPTLGVLGCLEYFNAEFRGQERTVTLEPAENFPGKVVSLWERLPFAGA
ncbi:MAG: hypothetical protein WD200_00210 [Candidatus Andersenbacteria bacterium]